MKFQIHNLCVELVNAPDNYKKYFLKNFNLSNNKSDIIIEFRHISLNYYKIIHDIAIYDEKQFYILEKKNKILFDLKNIILEPQTDLEFFINNIFNPVIMINLLPDCFLLHACSFLYKNKGVLLLGKGGCNRTSLMLSFNPYVISDDLSIIDKKKIYRYSNLLHLRSFVSKEEYKDNIKYYSPKLHYLKRAINKIISYNSYLFGLKFINRIVRKIAKFCSIDYPLDIRNIKNITSGNLNYIIILRKSKRFEIRFSKRIYELLYEIQISEFKSFFEYYFIYKSCMNKKIEKIEHYRNYLKSVKKSAILIEYPKKMPLDKLKIRIWRIIK